MEALERSIERVNGGKRRRDESEPRKPRKKRTNSVNSNEDLQYGVGVEPKAETNLKTKAKEKDSISLTFQKFIDETIQRLKESEKISLEQAIEIQSLLESKQLGNTNVSLDLQKELNRVCRIEYDEIEKNSDRLSGYGWSRTKIATHMKRKLQEKIDESMDVIQGFIASDSNPNLKRR
jgi:hypothetical protein